MQICTYCFTENSTEDLNCCYCKAPLNIERAILKESIDIEKIDIFYVDYFRLKNLNAIELLHLLSYIRKERAKYYVKNIEFEEQSQEYQLLSKQGKLIENVLFDVFGRIPKQIVLNDLKRYKNMQKRTINYHNAITKKVHDKYSKC